MLKELLLQRASMPLSVDADARTVTVNFYTGATVDRYNYWTGEEWKLQLSIDPAHVDLATLKTGRAPFLDGHMSWGGVRSTLGVIESAWLTDGGGMAKVRFSDRPDVQGIFEDVKTGILRNVSVGAKINELKDITPKGEKVKTMLAVDWAPEEISLVPIGADPDAQVLSAAALSPADIMTHLQHLAGASSKIAALEARVAEMEARHKLSVAMNTWRKG